jgi:hypothetical protein
MENETFELRRESLRLIEVQGVALCALYAFWYEEG